MRRKYFISIDKSNTYPTGENVGKGQLSTNDFEIEPKKYSSHSVFDRTDMHAYLDVATALRSIRKHHGQDIDIVGDDSRYFEFYLMVNSSYDTKKRSEKFWLDFTPLHYGGWRYWLKCLECRHRKTKLYITNDRVACMKCLGLIYTTKTGSKESSHVRLYKQMKAIDMLKQRRRKSYAGKPTRHARRLQRYYQDLSDLAESLA